MSCVEKSGTYLSWQLSFSRAAFESAVISVVRLPSQRRLTAPDCSSSLNEKTEQAIPEMVLTDVT